MPGKWPEMLSYLKGSLGCVRAEDALWKKTGNVYKEKLMKSLYGKQN